MPVSGASSLLVPSVNVRGLREGRETLAPIVVGRQFEAGQGRQAGIDEIEQAGVEEGDRIAHVLAGVGHVVLDPGLEEAGPRVHVVVIRVQADVELPVALRPQVDVAHHVGETALQGADEQAVGIALHERGRTLGLAEPGVQRPVAVEFHLGRDVEGVQHVVVRQVGVARAARRAAVNAVALQQADEHALAWPRAREDRPGRRRYARNPRAPRAERPDFVHR